MFKRLLVILSLGFVTCFGQAEKVRVGGYEFAPFVFQSAVGNYRGVTLDLINALNHLQDDYQFELVVISPPARYKAFKRKRFDTIFFESMDWGWQDHEIEPSKVFLSGGEVYVAMQGEERDQSYFDQFADKSIIGMQGYHYGLANFNSDPEYLKQQHNFILTRSNVSAIRMLEKGRGDVAIITLSFLKLFLKEEPSLASQLLVSEKLDQEYRHTILVRKQHKISVAQINGWLDELEQQGMLAKIWAKWGLDAEL